MYGNIFSPDGSIGPSIARANTEARELNIFQYCPTIVSAIIDLLYDFYI